MSANRSQQSNHDNESSAFTSQQSAPDSSFTLASGSSSFTTEGSEDESTRPRNSNEPSLFDPPMLTSSSTSSLASSSSSNAPPYSTGNNYQPPPGRIPYDPIPGRSTLSLPSWRFGVGARSAHSEGGSRDAIELNGVESLQSSTRGAEPQQGFLQLPPILSSSISSPQQYQSSSMASSSSSRTPASRHQGPDGRPLPGRDRQGYVDLTADTSSPSMPRQNLKRPRDRESSSDTGIPKRTKSSRPDPDIENIEEIDLRDVDDEKGLAAALQKQRADQVLAQNRKEGEAARTLTSLQCVICMDVPSDLTITHCGHLFCHTCLMEALMAGERQSGGGTAPSRCPVCRTRVRRNPGGRGGREVIPLELKVMRRSDYKKLHDPSSQ